MAVTKVVRKLKGRRAKASRRRTDLKNLNFQPVIKNVDIEELKAEFTKKPAKKAAKAKEEKVERTTEAVEANSPE